MQNKWGMPVTSFCTDTLCSRYEERIGKAELRVTVKLRDQLSAAKNASEMFRIFGHFNALFVRPQIRSAVRQYQVCTEKSMPYG